MTVGGSKNYDQAFTSTEIFQNKSKNLNHPNIAKLENILEIDHGKNCVIFELEYCSGPELGKYLKKYTSIHEK